MKKNIFKFASWNALFIASIFLISTNISHALTFGDNIITNGGAEDSRGFTDGRLVKVKKWQTTDGTFTVIKYGKNDNFLTLTSPGPAKKIRGKNYFSGGDGSQLSRAIKTVKLSSIAKIIDTNKVSFKLSGFFGGWKEQDDNAVLTAEFLNVSKQPISQVSIGSVLAADRANISRLLPRKLRGVIPAGTRSIRLVLTMIRVVGKFNDGYADNLSMVLAKKR